MFSFIRKPRQFLAHDSNAQVSTPDGRHAYVYIGNEGDGTFVVRLWLAHDHALVKDDPEWDPSDYLHDLGRISLDRRGDVLFEPVVPGVTRLAQRSISS